MNVVAVMPGSFDPYTLGHHDILVRAAELFGTVIVAVGVNAGKTALLGVDERVGMVRAAVAGLPGVTVAAMPGLLVDFCREQGATVVVRGARSGSDFDAEWAMAAMNESLGGIATVVLPARPEVAFISSTLVRSIVRAGGDVSAYVPASVRAGLGKENS